jgi:hypothetical protein
MKRFALVVLALSLLVTIAQGRKFTDEIKNKALKNTRRVQQSYGSSRQIYLNFGKYYWRLDMRPPALEVGWEWVQSQPLLTRGKSFLPP